MAYHADQCNAGTEQAGDDPRMAGFMAQLDVINFKARFAQPHAAGGLEDTEPDPYCVGWD